MTKINLPGSKPSAPRSRMLARVATFAAGLLVSASAFAATEGNLQHAGVDLGDQGSLQRGAKLYMNYCSG